MEIVKINGLDFQYANGAEPALRGVSLRVAAGEFVVVCGRSGSGKTTLLRHLKPQLAPRGERHGEILFNGEPLSSLDERSAAAKIGFVAQYPEGQLVTDRVWHELAFGLESLGVPTNEIRRRVAETASFFGLHKLFREDTASLSGGQKQLLNLAAVMVTQPELLLLDEPTSRLDPIAAAEFLAMLGKINAELGTTVILTEHRLEEALPLASRVVVMERGAVACEGAAADVARHLQASGSGLFQAMPAATRVWGELGAAGECPVSVNEGRVFLRDYLDERGGAESGETCGAIGDLSEDRGEPGAVAIELRGAWFCYERGAEDVLRGCDFRARFGEIVCVVGGNGAGKSTLLRILAGAKKPQRGTIKRNGKRNGRVCLLPQEPRLLFSKKTLAEELLSENAEKIAKQCGIFELLDRHPYDLSGGETARAALAKLLISEPEILLLDEPTSGLDAEAKSAIAELLRGLADSGACVVIVSHDIEFCAGVSTRAALFFDGAIASEGTPRELFSGNAFYTTAAHRLSRGFVDNAVTVEDVVEGILGSPVSAPFGASSGNSGSTRPANPALCEAFPKGAGGEIAGNYGGETLPPPSASQKTPSERAETEPDTYYNRKTPMWRKICSLALVCLCAAAWWIWGRKLDFNGLLGAGGVTSAGWRVFAAFGTGILALVGAALLVRGGKPLGKTGKTHKNPRPRKDALKSALVAFVLIAAAAVTVWLGVTVFPSYYLTATAIIIECLAAFFVAEERHSSARRLAVIAALCALGVAGRAAFFWLPQVKPVLAIAILAGAGLGGEAGFTVGAVTMLVSNIMFGQGMWTPWQMFAAGTCGLLGGLFFHRRFAQKRAALAAFGAAAAIIVYGGIVNPSAAFIWAREALSLNIVATYWLTGLPFDAAHAFGTAAFLLVLSEPILGAISRTQAAERD
ncbi:MAG: ATP-binding cassette domain-containing protein [Oscillospiraceae bacterium]|nr:ATP-binding cassette domain-containing protein [Oscillospiraceae bacterium]